MYLNNNNKINHAKSENIFTTNEKQVLNDDEI